MDSDHTLAGVNVSQQVLSFVEDLTRVVEKDNQVEFVQFFLIVDKVLVVRDDALPSKLAKFGVNPSGHGRGGFVDVVFHFGKNESLLGSRHEHVGPGLGACTGFGLVDATRGDSGKAPSFRIPVFGNIRIGVVAAINVITDHFCQSQTLTTALHAVNLCTRLLCNDGTVVHGIHESDVIGNSKDGETKIHEDTLHSHTGQFTTSTMATLRRECGSNFSIRGTPSS
mmetsp:Transcript_19481/g.40330  ORF Transcript_19481/g.40330 Transcript_19481/m.40330 type:complete len:225 (-) Transcript_19481:1448-2122(-)